MGYSLARANALIDSTTGRGTSTTYLAALTAVPSVGDTLATMSEDATAGYARQPVTWSAPAVPVGGVDPQSSNVADVVIGPFTAAQALPIVAMALVTAASGTVGELRWFWPLDQPYQGAVNDSFLVAAGAAIHGIVANDAA